VTAGLQRYLALERLGDFLLDAVEVEQRARTRVQLDRRRRPGHESGGKLLLRDDLRGVSRVLVIRRPSMRACRSFAAAFMSGAAPPIELYAGPRPLFDLNGVEEEIAKALERKVPLKSGGHLVIDQTEAMTTIDVNTGAYVGHRNLEETIFRTNLEAAVEHRAATAAAQSRRHHHHRLHRHAR